MQTRSSAKLIGASLPSPGTVCTKCHQAGHISRDCTVSDCLLGPLLVPPETLIVLGRVQPGLSDLPREIRDLIYKNLVISPFLIKVRYDSTTEKVYIRLLESGKRGIAAAFMFEAVLHSSLAPEVYEVFFKNNTFECGDCQILEQFISSRYTNVEVRMDETSSFVEAGRTFVKARLGEPYEPMQRKELRFDKRPWLRNLKVNLHCDNQEVKAAEQLGLALKLPRLNRLEISMYGLCNKRGKINSIDLTIAQIAAVCRKLGEKLGARLTVRVLKSWLGICNSPSSHYLHENVAVSWQDVSWMWGSPGEVARVDKERVGTHREHMQLMIATKNLLDDRLLRVFGEHWSRDHIEMEEKAKSKIDIKDAVH